MIVEIDLKPLKEFIINCVENLDYEVNFNFLLDESTKEVFMEILKGSSDMDSESIMDANKFSYLQGHTHFLSYSQKWEYSPPSASDYTTFLESYYRFYTRKMLIFSKDGIWEISLADKLKFNQTTNNSAINQQMQLFQDYLMEIKEDGYRANRWWTNMLDTIREKANTYHIQLAKPPGTPFSPHFYPISLSQYIVNMESLGFNVKLTPWNKTYKAKNMTYKIDIDDDDYHFVNYFVKNRQDYDVDIPSYLYIGDLHDETLYDVIIHTPNGQRVMFDFMFEMKKNVKPQTKKSNTTNKVTNKKKATNKKSNTTNKVTNKTK